VVERTTRGRGGADREAARCTAWTTTRGGGEVETWTERERGGAAAMWWSKRAGVAVARERRGRKDGATAPWIARWGATAPGKRGGWGWDDPDSWASKWRGSFHWVNFVVES
jgi:hypothetical protein